MKISFKKYPIDILLCMLWSIILLPIALLNLEGTIRIILAIPFILFITGYIIVFILFPTSDTDGGINTLERITLSFGLSIAIVSLIGLGLNYTPWGIRLVPILFSMFILIIVCGFIAIYRWIMTNPDKRFTITYNLSLPKSESKLNNVLSILLIALIIIAVSSLIYLAITPNIGEQFTEFYLLSSDKSAGNYTHNMDVGENAEGIIGIVNHEYRTVNYTVEIWLVNQTSTYNETEQKNYIFIHHMWFVDKITTTLDHFSKDLGQSWTPQWEEKFSVPITQNGSFKLVFLLFTTPTDTYLINKDYKDIVEEKFNSAYRELHLWIDVPFSKFYLQGPNGTNETYYRNIIIGENVTGITGIVNHEYKTVEYTIEIWLVNQSISYNEILKENITTIHNLWFLDKITKTLEHTEQSTQWEQNYSFMIKRTGSFRLAFLLFPQPTEGYISGEDYIEKANIKFISAYKGKYILIDVN